LPSARLGFPVALCCVLSTFSMRQKLVHISSVSELLQCVASLMNSDRRSITNQ
jgi:hypothetical protein